MAFENLGPERGPLTSTEQNRRERLSAISYPEFLDVYKKQIENVHGGKLIYSSKFIEDVAKSVPEYVSVKAHLRRKKHASPNVPKPELWYTHFGKYGIATQNQWVYTQLKTINLDGRDIASHENLLAIEMPEEERQLSGQLQEKMNVWIPPALDEQGNIDPKKYHPNPHIRKQKYSKATYKNVLLPDWRDISSADVMTPEVARIREEEVPMEVEEETLREEQFEEVPMEEEEF